MGYGIIYSIVVPVFNEELVISECHRKLKEVMDETNEEYEIIFVNDGSTDTTRKKAEVICKKDKNVKLVNFSRNFGHQAAITAGMDISNGEAIVVIDADLQDPPEVILKMIEKWKQGYEIVYGKRLKREGETFLKKVTSKMYYRILRSMTSIDIPVDVGDFRLIDRKVCDALSSLPEKSRYVRGLVSWVGFKQTYVEFVRHERFAGKTKYSLSKMIKLAVDGITSMSYKPLSFANYFGSTCITLGIIAFIIITIKNALSHVSILSLDSILAINIAMFGTVFISHGIMGQYISRIFEETKERPVYVIDNILNYKEIERYEGKN